VGRPARPAEQAAGDASHGEPVIVHIRDVRSGEMEVFAGTSHARRARLAVIAATYGAVADEILRAVPYRIQTMLDGIPAAAGDEGMARLMAAGEPGNSASALAGLIGRIPAIGRHLG
jgi:hypothetical protein